jgi:hypothetical protein
MDHPAARRSLRTGYPLEDRRAQATTHQLSGIPYSHPAILSRPSTRTVRGRPGKSGPMLAGGINARRRGGGV